MSEKAVESRESRVESGDAVLACSGLAKSFWQGDVEVPVLNAVDFELSRGESVAIVGSSGSALARPRPVNYAIVRWASSISSTISCRNSRRWKM